MAELPGDVLARVRRIMSDRMGVIRDGTGLRSARAEILDLMARHGPAGPMDAARLMVDAAMAREESRGGHHRSDFPGTLPVARHTRIAGFPGPVVRAAA
jgi:L-aspartate oxidase